MRLLKFFLWVILATCVAWGSIITFGPTLIAFAINKTFKNSIEVGRLEVSPKLEVNASFLKFDIAEKQGIAPMRGVVRAVNLSWQTENGFALVATLGPSRVEDFVAKKEVSFKLTPRGLLDWSTVELDGILSSVEYGEVTASQVKFSAKLIHNKGILKNASLNSDVIDFKSANLSTEKLTLSLAEVDLSTPFDRQDIPFKLDILGSLTSTLGRADGVNINGEILGNALKFDVSADRVQADKFEVTADGILMSSTYNLASKKFGPTLDIVVSRVEVENPQMKILNYQGIIKPNNYNILNSANMNIKTIVLENETTMLAKISDAVLQYDMSMPAISKKEYPIRLSAQLKITDDLEISSEVYFGLLDSDLIECIFKNCSVAKSAVRYVVEVPDAKLSGESRCEQGLCSIDQMAHSVITDNTDVFFRRLAEEKVLSPLVLPLAYYAMIGAEENGSGHRLDF